MPTLTKRRILVVEDNRDIAQFMAFVLEGLGQQVELALTGMQALELAKRSRPEIVFLDIGLPDLDGYEVAKRLRELKELEPLRIFATTAYSTVEARQRALEAGCDLHLIKPIDPESLPNLL